MTSTAAAPTPEPQIVEGIAGRAYLILPGLTLKQRNAARKDLEADGWELRTLGSNRRGWELRGWKGEPPLMVEERFGLVDGTHGVTPYYRTADYETSHELETIDGAPRVY